MKYDKCLIKSFGINGYDCKTSFVIGYFANREFKFILL
jgi:hypothetical protein